MKLRNIFRILSAGVVLAGAASCHNSEKIFPDYEGGISAYFAYQYPVRTIVLGESETFDTSLDNQHKCIIYGTIGGSYKGKDVVIDIDVDNSLVENLYFADGSPVQAMPENYYTLGGDQLNYGGTHLGGVEVQLTDAFFADPAALKNTYVIPVVMTDVVKGADRIKSGTPLIEGETPIRTNPALWNVAPMDYTLYCIKYVNQWDGSWLRRGVDQVTGQDAGTVVRHEQYVENDEVVRLTTESLDAVTIPVSTNISTVTTTVNKVISDGGYALHINNAEAQSEDWMAQTWYNLTEPIVAGETYVLKCMTKATADYSAQWIFQHDYNEQQWAGYMLDFTTEWTERTVTFNPDLDVYNKLTLNFGKFVGTLMIDNMVLTKAGSDVNIIANGDFEANNANGWSSSWGIDPPFHSVGVGFGGIVEEVVETTDVNAKTCQVKLTFDANGNCTVTSATEGMTASGSGKYVKDGEKLAWGNKDRDGIYLDYTVDFGEKQYAIKDTLVSRSREIKLETYIPTYQE